jgi:hypothetical protein
VASFFPLQATYWLNGHSFIERELNQAGVGFHKNDNAFLAVDDVAALQAADRLSPVIIRKQLDYWTLTEVLEERTRADQLVAILRHRPNRVLSQFHLQTPLSDP